MPEGVASFLRRADLFPDLPGPLLEELVQGAAELRVGAGERVFAEGEPGDAVYLVVEGRLLLQAGGASVASRGPGEYVGEFAVIDGKPRSATATAEAPGLLLRWPVERFHALLEHHPQVARRFLGLLTGKLREDIVVQVQQAAEQERWAQDLRRAREIQLGMLPAEDLRSERLQVVGYCESAVEVGGDYYDYLRDAKGRVGIVVSDVTGHGFYSGLLVAMAKSCTATQARFDASPAVVLDALQRVLELSIQPGMLMSCCYVLLDPERGRLRFANAGHPPPLHYRAAERDLETLEPLDPILGAPRARPRFEEVERPWAAGDALVLYSDGVTEARDAEGEMFGEERLERALLEHTSADAAGIQRAILGALERHCAAGPPRSDDWTLVVAKGR